MIKGLFVAFEGIDGCGKSTIAKEIIDWIFFYSKKIDAIVLTREPTSSKFGKQISEKLKSDNSSEEGKERLLEWFVLDREQHVDNVIVPSLQSKSIVLCDRYKYSTIAYQTAQGIPFQKTVDANDNFPKPDVTLIFNVSSEEAMKRLDNGRNEIDKFEKQEFLEKVRTQYAKLPQLLPKEKFVIINANQTVEQVLEDTKKALKPFIDERL